MIHFVSPAKQSGTNGSLLIHRGNKIGINAIARNDLSNAMILAMLVVPKQYYFDKHKTCFMLMQSSILCWIFLYMHAWLASWICFEIFGTTLHELDKWQNSITFPQSTVKKPHLPMTSKSIAMRCWFVKSYRYFSSLFPLLFCNFHFFSLYQLLFFLSGLRENRSG